MAARLLQRLLILGLGIFSIWLIVFVFELVDRRLPWILASVLLMEQRTLSSARRSHGP
jgi:hypothetical protein